MVSATVENNLGEISRQCELCFGPTRSTSPTSTGNKHSPRGPAGNRKLKKEKRRFATANKKKKITDWNFYAVRLAGIQLSFD